MKKVLLAMSGGVDSSVAAIMLQEKGYEVIGVTMRLLENDEEIQSAKLLCEKLNITHYILDLRDQFKKCVVEKFANAYKKGETPNPCIICNQNIKFGELYNYSKQLKCDYFSTGHYAKVEFDKKLNQYVIKKSNAIKKDQTYVLYGINKEIIKDLIFPLGEFESKEQIRQVALEHNLEVANKKDSQEICFIPDKNYSAYIEKECNYKAKSGNIVNKNGAKLGVHKGIINYTIGQRKGIGITSKTPLYVLEIKINSNEVVVGEERDLYSYKVYADNFNFLIPVYNEMCLKAKIRYSTKEARAKIYFVNDDNIKVVFEEPQRAITPGQSIVFYIDDILVGGGIIRV